MNTEKYCKTLDNLDKEKAIEAIHQAYLQLNAIEKWSSDVRGYFDNEPTLKLLKECLTDAKHIGFID